MEGLPREELLAELDLERVRIPRVDEGRGERSLGNEK